MRLFKAGSGYSVSVSRAEVEAFRRQWPCSGLPSSRVTFSYASNGDLVDITPYRVAARFDGPAAVALSEDARAYARQREVTP